MHTITGYEQVEVLIGLDIGKSAATVSGVVRSPERASQGPASRPILDRPGSWASRAPEGAYGPIPAWTSGAAWFDALMDVLATPAGEEIRRQAARGSFRVAGDS